MTLEHQYFGSTAPQSAIAALLLWVVAGTVCAPSWSLQTPSGDTVSDQAPDTRPTQSEGPAGRLDRSRMPSFHETIVVTARKREESLISVPLSVSTVTARDLEERAAASLLEGLDTLPNVLVESTNSSFPGIAIRGVTNSNALGFEPAVGVYLDEIYLPQPGAIDKLLLDVERIEILRGPQGTAYGKNTVGGLVNVVTTRPGDETSAAVDLTYGRFDLRQARASVEAAPAAKISTRLSVGLQQRDGWMENRTVGAPDLMSEDSRGARGQILLRPSADAEVLFSVDYSRNDDLQNAPDISAGPLFFIDGMDGRDRSIATNEESFNRREVSGGTFRLDLPFARHRLTSLSAYRSFEFANLQDQDATALALVATGTQEEVDYFSQELRFSPAFGDRFTYLAGLFYADRAHWSRFEASLGEDLPPLFGLPQFVGYLESVETLGHIDERSVAGFFSGSYAVHGRATLELGVRVSDETKEFRYAQGLTPFFVAPGLPLRLINAFAAEVEPLVDRRSDTEPSGDLSFIYGWSPDLTGYVRVARGFKAGGFSAGLASSPEREGRRFDSESVNAFELGFKSLLAKRRLRLNASVFYLDYDDKQEQVWTGTQFLLRNAAQATSKGAELDLAATPISGFELRLAAGYTDARYDRFVDQLLGEDYSGNRLVDAPEWNASVAAQYHRPIASSAAMFVRAEANYRDENPKTFDNDPRFVQGSHTPVNARIGLELVGGKYTVAAWGKNVTDEDYLLAGFELLGTSYGFLNQPATYGVEWWMRW